MAHQGDKEQARKRLKAIESFPALKVDDETKELAKKLVDGRAFTRLMVRQIVENQGYVCPEICYPDELLGE